MEILFLSQLVPYPLDAGPKIRIYHVLQHLASLGHQITLVAFRRGSDSRESIDHLRQYCHDVHTVPIRRSRMRDAWHLAQSLITNQPFLITRDRMAAMDEVLQKLLAHGAYDAIHADQLWMAQYALAAQARYRSEGKPMITLDQHNAVFLIPKRLASGAGNPLMRVLLNRESDRLAHYEVETCRQFDHVVWVSAEDRRAVAEVANGTGSQGPTESIIPICVDTEAKAVIRRNPGGRRVTFLGGLHWLPNREGIHWFVRNVWPLVVAQVPDALLTIVGKDASIGLASPDSPAGNLEVVGYVADPAPYLADTAAFIVPLHAGGGMRVKILDAWSWGLPIVATTIGAEGVAYRDGENLLLANTEETFAQAVVRLLREPELAARLGAAGRRTVETHYDWRCIYHAWNAIYGTVQA
jgi:polysaccharide biosynthesis protein PslH